jgi:hypothetical protein
MTKIDRPAKRKRRVSQDLEDEIKLQSHPQQSSDGATIEAEVSQALFDNNRTRSLILQRFQCAHPVPYGGADETSTLQPYPGYISPQTAGLVLLHVEMLRHQICRENAT